jgi:hypothetical protein
MTTPQIKALIRSMEKDRLKFNALRKKNAETPTLKKKSNDLICKIEDAFKLYRSLPKDAEESRKDLGEFLQRVGIKISKKDLTGK